LFKVYTATVSETEEVQQQVGYIFRHAKHQKRNTSKTQGAAVRALLSDEIIMAAPMDKDNATEILLTED
jgi:Spy/CpxP family protein refolding chaperone